MNEQYNLMYEKVQLEKKKGNFYYPETIYSILMYPQIDLNLIESISPKKNIEQLIYPENYTFYNFPLNIFTLDYDLLSLEDENSLQNLFLKNDHTSLLRLSEIITEMEFMFGKIKNFYYKGDKSKCLYDLILRCENEENINNINTINPKAINLEILSCIMIDRNIDFITPFASQFNYEGIIDDFFNIDLNSINVDSSIIENKENKNQIIFLDERDHLYYMIKDYNFNRIRQFLPKRLKLHSAIFEMGKKVDNLKGISQSIKKIKQISNERSSLSNHIDIAEYISQSISHPLFKRRLNLEQLMLSAEFDIDEILNFYDNEISKKGNLYSILKLLIIQSQVNGGLKEKVFNKYKKVINLIYGFQSLILWNNLEKMKIIKKRDGNDFYKFLIKKLELIKKNVNVYEPNDSSYVFNGYCPITIRIIENVFNKGWFNIKEILNKMPGELFYPENENEILKPKYERNVIMLVFVGGITYSEIGCIRYLNKKFPKYRFVILTTFVINSNRLFNNLSLNILPKDTYYTSEFKKNLNEQKSKHF